ncbi:Heparinase II/III-like protein [Hyphomicrobium sulfonivorans]|uniref:Heparinase II/III-like protein n=1 Tax=Hyphomicrobium sulfonivorans TaxID=121290 RepID=A0A125NVW0_HYPSL|nr:heparinase II/III family protein [Hyphomicrobium sulfonivorans]KWT70975.1 Heparinase II/III-like protein [Hyphomicrobium sulfonivorans]
MAELTLKDRLRRTALHAHGAHRTGLAGVLTMPLRRLVEPAPELEHLLIVPQDLRTADPSFWDEIGYGQFGLAGSVVVLNGRSPFEVDPVPSVAWAQELHGFGWLRNLSAIDVEGASATARRLALEWIDGFDDDRRGVAADPQVAARRLISWLSHANLLLEDADRSTYTAITGSLRRQFASLASVRKDAPMGYPRLLVDIALSFAVLSIAGFDRHARDVEANLNAELAWQILADGGHVTRNPAVLADLLLDLLPLSQCFTAREQPLPDQLQRALNVMVPMLHYLRLGDGMLARFNGAPGVSAAAVATVAAYDDNSRPPLIEARASGYARLRRGSTVILADVGSPPQLALSSSAHAGCLSFEMSAGAVPLFVNSGAPCLSGAEWGPAARATASHNTLTLADRSSARLIAHRKLEALLGSPPIRYPDRVDWRIEECEGETVLQASHDGYCRRHELVHTRTLRLDTDGLRLTGVDRLSGVQGQLRLRDDLPFAIHFHLMPGVRLELGETPREAVVTLPDGQLWRLSVRGATLCIEESSHFAGSPVPRPSMQIVLRGATFGETEVSWVVERLPEATETWND